MVNGMRTIVLAVVLVLVLGCARRRESYQLGHRAASQC
jgi:hypothetical protein